VMGFGAYSFKYCPPAEAISSSRTRRVHRQYELDG
jgi:hypothetical protein